MEGTKTLDQRLLKRYFQTRRFTGRRGITPMKSKHKKSVPKTRGHKVEKRPYVPIRKHTGSQQHEQRTTTDTKEHSEDTERKGDQDSHSDEGRKNEEEHAQINEGRDTENSDKSVHPGPIQAVPHLYKWCADDTEADETEIESEELQ
jgi:DNA polymerase sigma